MLQLCGNCHVPHVHTMMMEAFVCVYVCVWAAHHTVHESDALVISETHQRIFLKYPKNEIRNYTEQKPDFPISLYLG